MTDNRTLAAIFWSRGRKVFLEVTLDDVQRRMSAPQDVASRTMQLLTEAGLVSKGGIIVGSAMIPTWYLNKDGRSVIRRHLEDAQS